MLLAADRLTDGDLSVDGFWWALLVALVASAVTLVIEVAAGSRRRQRVLVPGRPADRAQDRRADPHRRARDRVPRDRRPRAPGAAPCDAGRQRAAHGPLGGGGGLSADRMGARPLVPDGGEPGGDPARVERGHPGISLGGEGDREGDDLLGARGLRRDRATARLGQGAAPERRGEPRQPALGAGGRGDPHREPDRGRETREPGLPDVLRERLQRDAGARAVRLGADHRMDRRSAGETARRPAARSQRRDLSVHAGRDVRRRARPHRPGRAHGHDERSARDLRDLLELRRGRPPLRPRACRHARGAAQARPPVRSHRARPTLRTAPVRDRGALGLRPDPGRDVQAAKRPRARRARPAVARGGRRHIPHER